MYININLKATSDSPNKASKVKRSNSQEKQ